MLAAPEEVRCDQVGIIDHLGQIADRLCGQLCLVAAPQQLSCSQLRGQRSEVLIKLGLVPYAATQLTKPFLCDKAGIAQQRKDPVPGIKLVQHDADITVSGRERLAHRIKLASIADRAERRVKRLPAQMFQHHETGKGFEHRHFHQLPRAGPLAVKQRGQRGIGGVQPSNFVGNQRGQIARARIAIDARQQRGSAGGSLNHIVIGLQVGIGAILAEPDAVEIDQPGMRRAQRRKVEPEPRQGLPAHIDHEQVGLCQQRVQHCQIFGLFQIERNRTLAPVERHEPWRHIGRRWGLGRPAERVAGSRALNLDDFRAQISQHLRTIRPEHHRGQVNNLDPLQHRRAHTLYSPSSRAP